MGNLQRALLRNGSVASADDWRSMLELVVARYRDLGIAKNFRGDAAFAIPVLYTFLETESYLYAIRLKSNAVLERNIQHLLTRAVDRPPRKPVVWYYSVIYRAGSWDHERRVVAKVRWEMSDKGQVFNGIVWLVLVPVGYVCFVIPGLFSYICLVSWVQPWEIRISDRST